MEYFEVIHHGRARLGLSRSAFARLVGVDRIQVWRWETGATNPSPVVASIIAQVLDVDVDSVRDKTRPGPGGRLRKEDRDD